MIRDNSNVLDVAVVGGGPAGISACLELSKHSHLKVALFERSSELGGIPKYSSLFFFGMRDRKRISKGTTYARIIDRRLRKTPTKIYTDTTVTKISPETPPKYHKLETISKEGARSFDSRFVILATGCCESSRAARIIPGTRPPGIYTTGELEQLSHNYKSSPGKKAVIIGSENVVFPCVLSLKNSGVDIVGIVEEDQELHTYPFMFKGLMKFFGIPIYKGISVENITGEDRVEKLELKENRTGKKFELECDTVIITGKFRSYAPLLDNTSLELDGETLGPLIDTNMMTSVKNIYCAGNIMRGANMHDLCALEGKQVAKNIVEELSSNSIKNTTIVPIKADSPIRYVVPQKLIINRREDKTNMRYDHNVSIQLSHTFRNIVLEARSGSDKIWNKSFSRIIANNRVPIPTNNFDWNRVDRNKGIILKAIF